MMPSDSSDPSTAQQFLAIKTVDELTAFLEIDKKKLNYLLYVANTKYFVFEIHKKNGTKRKISAPILPLKRIQEKVKKALELIYKPTLSVHGYIKNKNIVSSAEKHINKNYVLNVDLKDFFPSINYGRVWGLFKSDPFNFPEKIATLLAQICTFENQLPQGAPTSPIVSNMICKRLDKSLLRLSKQLKFTYTRYADDLTISTNSNEFPNKIAFQEDDKNITLGIELIKLIDSNGFTPNSEKIYLRNHKESQVVTGLKVNEFLNVHRALIRQIRAMLHAWEKHGYDAAEQHFLEKFNDKHRHPSKSTVSFSKVVRGKLNYVRMVRGPQCEIYQKLLAKYAALEGIINRHTLPNHVSKSLWVLRSDEYEDDYMQGTAFDLYGIGTITCYHCIKKSTYAFKAYDPENKYPIELVAANEELDLAIIKIKNTVPELPLEKDYEWKHQSGEKIVAIGYPNYLEGDGVFIGEGNITQRKITDAKNPWYLVSAKTVVGSSGGPVLNSKLKVIGVIATGAQSFTQSDTTEKHGYIPITQLKELQ